MPASEPLDHRRPTRPSQTLVKSLILSELRATGGPCSSWYHPPHAGRHARHHSRRRSGRAAVSADEGSCQAGRVLRRTVPDHRFHPEQLCELGVPPHLHRHAVQVALTLAAHPHGLEGVRRGARRIHRDSSAAEARRRALVSRARPTPSTRTSIPSSARSPRHIVVLSGDHVYKMDYAKMLRAHRERRRRVDDRVSRGAGSPTARASASFRSIRPTASLAFRKSPSTRRPFRAPTAWRSSRWASTSSRPTRSIARSKPTRRARRVTISARTSCRRMIHDARSSPTASTTRTRRRRSTGATSARSTPTTKRTWICAR